MWTEQRIQERYGLSAESARILADINRQQNAQLTKVWQRLGQLAALLVIAAACGGAIGLVALAVRFMWWAWAGIWA